MAFVFVTDAVVRAITDTPWVEVFRASTNSVYYTNALTEQTITGTPWEVRESPPGFFHYWNALTEESSVEKPVLSYVDPKDFVYVPCYACEDGEQLRRQNVAFCLCEEHREAEGVFRCDWCDKDELRAQDFSEESLEQYCTLKTKDGPGSGWTRLHSGWLCEGQKWMFCRRCETAGLPCFTCNQNLPVEVFDRVDTEDHHLISFLKSKIEFDIPDRRMRLWCGKCLHCSGCRRARRFPDDFASSEALRPDAGAKYIKEHLARRERDAQLNPDSGRCARNLSRWLNLNVTSSIEDLVHTLDEDMFRREQYRPPASIGETPPLPDMDWYFNNDWHQGLVNAKELFPPMSGELGPRTFSKAALPEPLDRHCRHCEERRYPRCLRCKQQRPRTASAWTSAWTQTASS